MPMAQVKTIKREEKCLTTPQPHPTPMLTQGPGRDGGRKRSNTRDAENVERRITAMPGCARGSAGLNVFTL